MAKKSFNPFKMWGAYVGLGVGIGLFIWKLWANSDGFRNASVLFDFSNDLLFTVWGSAILYLIIPAILGYLIHIIVRAVRN